MADPREGFLFRIETVFLILFCLNLLQYTDRGIIPGSTNEFSRFIQGSLHTNSPDIFIGILQSSFIVGFAIASIFFGNLVHYYSPFSLVSMGMVVWSVAALASGLSVVCGSYSFLVIARCLSGVGESSLACCLPPWIEQKAPAGKKASWLGLFYAAIPCGTALGFIYSSIISSTIGVRWAFFIELIVMVPFIVYLQGANRAYPEITSSIQAETPPNAESDKRPQHTDRILLLDASAAATVVAPTVIEELKNVFSSKIYVSLVAGYAAQTGALIGISTFGSALLQGLGFFKSEAQASAVFGLIVCMAGIAGSLGGGIVLDSWARRAREESEERDGELSEPHPLLSASLLHALHQKQSCSMVTAASTLGAVCVWSSFLIYDKFAFLFVVGLGCALIFTTVPGINIAIMLAVRVENRAFAIACCNLIIHLLGDVPSPIVSGWLKDKLAPGCVGVDAASASCRKDNSGLRFFTLIVSGWLCWALLFFAFAYFLAAGALKHSIESSEVLREDSKYYVALPTSPTIQTQSASTNTKPTTVLVGKEVVDNDDDDGDNDEDDDDRTYIL